MGICYRCACGRLLVSDEARVGGRLACPVCGGPVVVPPAERGLSPADFPDELPLLAEDPFVEPAVEVALADGLGRDEGVTADPLTDTQSPVFPAFAPTPEGGGFVASLERSPDDIGEDEPTLTVDERQAPPPTPAPHVREAVDEELAWGPRTAWRRRAEEVERDHRAELKHFNVQKAFLWSLAYPIRGAAGRYTLIIPVVIFLARHVTALAFTAATDFGSAFIIAFGVSGGAVLCPLAAAASFGWFHELVLAGSANPKDAPEWRWKDLITERLWPGVKGTVHFAVVAGLMGLAYDSILDLAGVRTESWFEAFIPTTTWGFLFLAVFLAYYGMSFLVLAACNSFWGSLNPVVVVRSIERVSVEYALTLAFSLGAVAGSLGLLTFINAHVYQGADLLWPWFAYYGACVAMSRLGFLVFRRRYDLGWTHRRSVREGRERKAAPIDQAPVWLPAGPRIRFRCECRRLVAAPRQAAGQWLRCPACRRRVKVPGEAFTVKEPEPEWGPEQEEAAEKARAKPGRGAPPAEAPAPSPSPFPLPERERDTAGTGAPAGRPAVEAFDLDAAPPPPVPAEAVVTPAPPPSEQVERTPETAERRRREREEQLKGFTTGKAFAWAFAFPLTGTGRWLTLALPIVLLGLQWVPCVGQLLVLGVYYGWLVQIIQTASYGPRAHLEWGDLDFVQDRLWPAVKILVNAVAVLGLPALITARAAASLADREPVDLLTYIVGHAYLFLMWLAVFLFYAMSFTVAAAYGDLKASLDPRVVVRSIRRILGEYLAVCGFTVALVLLERRVILPGLDALSAGLDRWLAPFLDIYVICVVVSRLGFMACRNREQLGWT